MSDLNIFNATENVSVNLRREEKETAWVRKSLALDREKNFSQLTREFLLAGLKTRGVEL